MTQTQNSNQQAHTRIVMYQSICLICFFDRPWNKNKQPNSVWNAKQLEWVMQTRQNKLLG